MENNEKPTSLIEASTDAFNEGFEAFKNGDYQTAKMQMEAALEANQYDIGAMVILALMDPDFEAEKGLYTSPEHRNAFATVTTSPHITNIYKVGNNLIAQMATEEGTEKIKLVDIGIGSAAQEVKLIPKLLEQTTVKEIDLIGIEPMTEMSDVAKTNLANAKEELKVNFETVQSTAQELPEEVVQDIRNKAMDVVIATISIHHATIEEKREILRKIKEMNTKRFVISDGDSDHDSHLEALSPELAKNIREYYSLFNESLCVWAEKTHPGRDDIKAAIKKFFFDEARNILSRDPKIDVKDYHTTGLKWKKLLEEEGFRIINPDSIEGITDGIEGGTEIKDDIIYMMRSQGRHFLFSIIAEAKE